MKSKEYYNDLERRMVEHQKLVDKKCREAMIYKQIYIFFKRFDSKLTEKICIWAKKKNSQIIKPLRSQAIQLLNESSQAINDLWGFIEEESAE